MKPTRVLAAFAATAAVAALATPAASASGAGSATVSVLHAVPGLTVDVYANGEELIPDFAPGTLTDPLTLPAGTYDLAVFEAGADPASATPAITLDDATVPAGANVTVVAHLGETGTPTLTPFVNDVSALDAGEARLGVRHTAAAPAVDVRAGGTPVIEGLTNPNEEVLVLDAGTVSADVVLAGTETVAIGPADVTLAEGTATFVYAWGSAEDGNLALAVQTVDGLHSSPSGVPSGESAPTTSLLAGAGALALLLVGGFGLLRRRQTV
jgi:MYXO-CTERM domain-containing protein